MFQEFKNIYNSPVDHAFLNLYHMKIGNGSNIMYIFFNYENLTNPFLDSYSEHITIFNIFFDTYHMSERIF